MADRLESPALGANESWRDKWMRNAQTWPSLPPNPADLDIVWRIDISRDVANRLGSANLLSAEEHARADRFTRAGDRDRFLVSHVAKRKIIASQLRAVAENLVFETAPGGKPILGGPWRDQLHFNLSHSGDCALIAVAQVEIGVDVEVVRPLSDWLQVARAHFSPREIGLLARVPQPLQLKAFYGCWTRKEAFAKALGIGLSMGLDRFSVTVPPVAAGLVEIEGDEAAVHAWQMHDLAPLPGHAGCAAWQTADAELSLRTLPESWLLEPR